MLLAGIRLVHFTDLLKVLHVGLVPLTKVCVLNKAVAAPLVKHDPIKTGIGDRGIIVRLMKIGQAITGGRKVIGPDDPKL